MNINEDVKKEPHEIIADSLWGFIMACQHVVEVREKYADIGLYNMILAEVLGHMPDGAVSNCREAISLFNQRISENGGEQ